MTVILNSNADMEKLDNLGETVEKALNKEHEHEGEDCTEPDPKQERCTLTVSEELYRRLSATAASANIQIEELIDRAVGFYVAENDEGLPGS